MPPYKLRTLLILLAIGPPVLATIWFETESVVLTVGCAVAMILVLITARPLDLGQFTGNDESNQDPTH
jgi:hypothetical protein